MNEQDPDLKRAARKLISSAVCSNQRTTDGDHFYWVPRRALERLRAALGEAAPSGLAAKDGERLR